MTLSSKNVAGFALALAILGLAAWISSSMLQPKTRVVGTIEVTDISN